MSEAHREEYIGTLSSRRDAATAHNVRFWVFENTDEPGRFIEFTEAASAVALTTFADGTLHAPIWREVQGD